jgi:hypothetical protein
MATEMRVSSISSGLVRASGPKLARGGLALLASVALASCFESHVAPTGTHRVKVEQVLFDETDGSARRTVPAHGAVVAWACEGDWREESLVFEDGFAYFSPPEGLDCWNLTAADLHHEIGGGATTILRAPLPLETSMDLPHVTTGMRPVPEGSVEGRVVGVPPGTERVDVTVVGVVGGGILRHLSSERLVFVGTEALEFSYPRRWPPAEDGLRITARAMREGFPVHGAEALVDVSSEGDIQVELAFAEEVMPVEVAEFSLSLPEGDAYPASEARVLEGQVSIPDDLGPHGHRVAGTVHLDELSVGEFEGKARWLPFTEEPPLLRAQLGWEGRGIGESGELRDFRLRVTGSADAISAAEIPSLDPQRLSIGATSEGSLVLDAEYGHEELITRLELQGSSSPYRRWIIMTLGAGRVRLEHWPALPAGHTPEDLLGAEPGAINPTHFEVSTPHRATPDGPASVIYLLSRLAWPHH